jgi:putative hydrolase
LLDRGGLAAVFATDRQRETLERLGGLMSLLEGHGEVVMNRAAAGRLPNAWRFERVMKTRRDAAGSLTRLLYKLVGFEAKMNQYAEGESFITAVESTAGRATFDLVWQGPEWLPTLSEIRAPQQWIDRVDHLPPGR